MARGITYQYIELELRWRAISESVGRTYLYLEERLFHLPWILLTWWGTPLSKASVVPPLLGECRLYLVGSNPAELTSCLKQERACEYDKDFPGTIKYSHFDVTHFRGGNRYKSSQVLLKPIFWMYIYINMWGFRKIESDLGK